MAVMDVTKKSETAVKKSEAKVGCYIGHELITNHVKGSDLKKLKHILKHK